MMLAITRRAVHVRPVLNLVEIPLSGGLSHQRRIPRRAGGAVREEGEAGEHGGGESEPGEDGDDFDWREMGVSKCE